MHMQGAGHAIRTHCTEDLHTELHSGAALSAPYLPPADESPVAAVQASTVHIAHLVELGEITLTRESLTLQSFALQNQVGSEGGRGGTGGANGSGSEATSLLTEAGLGRIEPWDD
eukprot:CAMPEP_0181179806 /NCGR_PEP_ID=MMETSP1096-20121128/6460_1 /TAXON_ID=156174 ORGANISM="Chrysochromulina ericina, Strain CCMP281" /NCGR_SAMPLE_ID=MMETSP1096 /ASSEMBLY_ACC=CAM_ASM_000453 /LENGTH=114 /DNA_ID=CAMNT_0023268187 /DNA_START=204 /DNA_END=546 /DNA_ORIENTATION=+